MKDELISRFKELHKKANSALISGFSRICKVFLDGISPESLDEAIDFFIAAKDKLSQAIEVLKLLRREIR